MKRASTLATALAASVLGFLAVPAQASPPAGMARELAPIAGEGGNVELARYRCYWHRGHRHCRYRYYGPRRHYHRHWRRHHRHHHRRHWHR
jgi:hypothetical protein